MVDNSKVERLIRSVTSAFSLFSAALIAHHLAGGTTIAGQALVTSLSFLVFTSLVFSRSELEGPRLGLLILLSQLMAHFLIGGNSENSTTMLASHVLSGALTYQVIVRIDNAILWLRSTFSPVLFHFQLKTHASEKAIISLTGLNYSTSSRFAAFQYWTTSPPLVVISP